jgi:ABC-type phosphate/phosphonate transport system permease subunit
LAQQTVREVERDVFLDAPPAPRRGTRFFVIISIALLVLAWSFQGAKLRPGELIQGIPQIAVTVGRMLPPDFSKVTDAKS